MAAKVFQHFYSTLVKTLPMDDVVHLFVEPLHDAHRLLGMHQLERPRADHLAVGLHMVDIVHMREEADLGMFFDRMANLVIGNLDPAPPMGPAGCDLRCLKCPELRRGADVCMTINDHCRSSRCAAFAAILFIVIRWLRLKMV